MPKNKKPQGGRPAKNFDPSYAKGGSKGGPARAGSSKPGSRSEGHRGYRPEARITRAQLGPEVDRLGVNRLVLDWRIDDAVSASVLRLQQLLAEKGIPVRQTA